MYYLQHHHQDGFGFLVIITADQKLDINDMLDFDKSIFLN